MKAKKCTVYLPTPKTEGLLTRLTTETALVPDWWFIEITNVLAMAERKGRITPASLTPSLPISASSESSGTMKLPSAHLRIC
jgi:hypothetical protein